MNSSLIAVDTTMSMFSPNEQSSSTGILGSRSYRSKHRYEAASSRESDNDSSSSRGSGRPWDSSYVGADSLRPVVDPHRSYSHCGGDDEDCER